MTRYRNPWHDPERREYGPTEFETDAKPQKYRGFDIYHRMPQVFDVVKGDVCVGQFAGFGGATRNIDACLDGNGVHYLTLAEASSEDTAIPVPSR